MQMHGCLLLSMPFSYILLLENLDRNLVSALYAEHNATPLEVKTRNRLKQRGSIRFLRYLPILVGK